MPHSSRCCLCVAIVSQELARLRKEEYWEQLEYEREQRVAMLAQRRADKYRKHYDICRGIMEQVVEFVCKVAEYRVLTGR